MPIYKQSENGRQMSGGTTPGEYIVHPVTCDSQATGYILPGGWRHYL